MTPQAVLTPRAAALNQLPDGARLDSKDVCSLFGCSKSTLLRRVAQGRAPAPIEQGGWRADSVRRFFEREVAA